MELIYKVNQTVIAFTLELIALYYVYRGSMLTGMSPKWFWAGVAIISFAGVWGSFLAPRAKWRFAMPWLFVGKYLLLCLPSYIWLVEQKYSLALFYSLFVLLHLVMTARKKTI